MTSTSSILFKNPNSTIFLIDIPASIALAQELSPAQNSNDTTATSTISNAEERRKRHLLSEAPLEKPYATTCEPKSGAARARVLATIPQSERELYEALQPVLANALNEIRTRDPSGSEWCFSRYLLEHAIQLHSVPAQLNPKIGHATWANNYILGKSKRSNTRRGLINKANSRPKAEYSSEFEARIDHGPFEGALSYQEEKGHEVEHNQPPLIIAPGKNRFEDELTMCNTVVKNTSCEAATIELRGLVVTKQYKGFDVAAGRDRDRHHGQDAAHAVFHIPPLSKFILCNLPLSAPTPGIKRPMNPIPCLSPDKRFNLIVLDPPWANKSVRRSGHYQTQTYLDNELLMAYIRSVLTVHSYLPTQDDNRGLTRENKSNLSIAAIWTTNSAKSRNAAYDALRGAGFSVCEEWLWLKTTTNGEPVTSLNGVWRKPYEVLLLGKRYPVSNGQSQEFNGDGDILRRVIAAVPDVHSRKPNLKEVFENVFFMSDSGVNMKYSALEVFARNLTAGWWACGNEVLKFNSEDWWVSDSPQIFL